MGIGGKFKNYKQEQEFQNGQYSNANGFSMYYNAELLPYKGISATEIAKGCRRMAGFLRKSRSLIRKTRSD